MIEQSIAKQYHILPSEQGELSYRDWALMVSGLMDDTPLGRVAGIRTEKDKDILKNFTPEQKQIRSEWQRFLARKKSREPKAQEAELINLQNMIAGMFGGRR